MNNSERGVLCDPPKTEAPQKTIRELINDTYGVFKERIGVHGGSETAALLALAEANVEGLRFVAQSIDKLTAAIESIHEDMEASRGRKRK